MIRHDYIFTPFAGITQRKPPKFENDFYRLYDRFHLGKYTEEQCSNVIGIPTLSSGAEIKKVPLSFRLKGTSGTGYTNDQRHHANSIVDRLRL